MDNSTPTAQDLLDLATELNEVIESIEPTEAPIGHFTVAPAGWGAGSIGFSSWGPDWNSDTDDRPQVDPEDEVSDDPALFPLREHLISEMEKLGYQILAFVELARRTGACETCEHYEHYEPGMDTWGHCAVKDVPMQDGDWCEGWRPAPLEDPRD